MMGGAHLDRAAVRLSGVYVVAVDRAPAGASAVAEQQLNDAAGARQIPPGGLIVNRGGHPFSLQKS
jgi:hypothetical protein